MTAPSKTVVAALQLLRRRVRFERACFELPGPEGQRKMSNDKDTAIIREATRLYMETWVVPIIDAIERGDTRGLQDFIR